jgi:oligopeptide transport system permease protein
LPALTLGTAYAAYIARLTRGGLLEVIRSDFVRTAHAKGLPERLVVWRHMLQGGLLPVVTFLGPAIANIMVGSVVVEKIFATPGIGPYFVDAAFNRDYFLVMGIVVLYSVFLLVMNLLVDIAYGFLDPRVRYE